MSISLKFQFAVKSINEIVTTFESLVKIRLINKENFSLRV